MSILDTINDGSKKEIVSLKSTKIQKVLKNILLQVDRGRPK